MMGGFWLVAPTSLPSSSEGADWACSFTRPACPLDEKSFGDPAY